MKAKIEFYIIENGQKRFLPLSDFAVGAKFTYSTKRGLKQGFVNALRRMNRTLHFNFGKSEVTCEAFAIYDDGRKILEKPIAWTKYTPYFEL